MCVYVCVCAAGVRTRLCFQWCMHANSTYCTNIDHPPCCLQVPRGVALPRPRDGSAAALEHLGQCGCSASFERGDLPWQAVLVAQVVADR